MINAYDFDKTIYDGDSTIDFYFFCLTRKKSIALYLPIQLFAMILYLFKIKDKEYFKEKFFCFLKKINNLDEYVHNFWKRNTNKIKPWYLAQKKNSDVIISASPEFLLAPLQNILNVDRIIATKVNKTNGKFITKNCYGKEKVRRFNKEVKKEIDSFYTDSFSDKPMMEIATRSFLVKKSSVIEIRKGE